MAGLALIEVLVSLLVIGLGVTMLARTQTGLWQMVDTTRDRSHALRVAESDLETLRLGPLTSVIAGSGRVPATDPAAPALLLTRSVQASTATTLRAVTTSVQWRDRRDHLVEVSLSSLLDPVDPRWSAWMSLAPGGPSGAGVLPGLPPQIVDLGSGQAAWRPLPTQATVWVLDLASGRVLRECTADTSLSGSALRDSTLQECRVVTGWLLTGVVRFATTTVTPGPRDAEVPLGPALPLAMDITLSEPAASSAPLWTCLTDAPATLPAAPSSPATAGTSTSVHYACRIDTGPAASRWSGRQDVRPIGWSLATSAADVAPLHFRVCRYSADADGNGRIDNGEHPATYSRVEAALTDQNFLIVPAAARCPTEPASLRQGADDSTVAHQP